MNEIETNAAEQMAAMNKAMREVGELYHITFNTPTGLKVLEHLTEMISGSSLNGNDMMDANASIQASEFMFIREGQDQVVRFINRMMKFYKDNK